MSENKARETRKATLQPGINLIATIEKLKQSLPIRDVLSRFTSFKDKTGLCFLHDEKSPSLTIHEKKETFKCFGCGAVGDIVNAYEKLYNENALEASLHICSDFSIEPVYSNDFDYKAYQQQQALKKSAIQSETLQAEKYQKLLLSSEGIAGYDYLKARSINDDTIKIFGLGFDDYMKTITIPLQHVKGEIIGLSKRFLNPVKSKYINPSNNDLYNKSLFLYGIYQAINLRILNKLKFCVLVEGYFCLWQLWQIGIKQVASTCGTSFTVEQMQLLKKQVQHIKLFFDNDEAGINGAEKSIIPLLENGFRVDIILIPGPFKDADEWIIELKKTKTDAEIQQIIFSDKFCQDAVVYHAKKLWLQANGQPIPETKSKNEIAEILFAIPEADSQTSYINLIVKAICIEDKNQKEKSLHKSITDALDKKILQAKQEKEVENNDSEDKGSKGFYEKDEIEKNGKKIVGYFLGKTQLTSFTVLPHFLIYSGIESRYLLSIYNGYRKAILDVPAKVITSIDQFQGYAVSEGNFLIFANKNQWLLIASDLLQRFPRCIEITRLGWQPFGFFAYLDKVYIPGEGLKDLDNMGMFTYKGDNFLVPASCEAYKQLQRIGEDPFENDRCLIYKIAHINFSQWALQMQKVYLEKGVVGVAYSILTIFRDLIFEVDGNCPHLYGWGDPSSGKSKLFESIAALFFFKRAAFNVNSGTDFAFFNYIGSFKNCFAHFNEVDAEVLKDEWFQAFKGWFDGEGRQRGKIGGGKNKTETMRPESTSGFTGQKVMTKDDNAFVQRCAILTFSITEKSEEQVKDYNILKQWEANGLNSLLTEILEYRSLFANEYKEHYKQQLGYWRKNKADVQQVNQRVLQNWCHLSTCYNLISKHISLPQPAEQFTEYCYHQAMHWSNFIHSSDTLSEFWKTIEFLVNEQLPKIVYGFDYTVETVMQVTIRVSKKQEETITFHQPTKVLFLRLKNVHTLFEMSYRSRKGKEAMSLDNIKHYFSSRKYNLGAVRQKWFSRIIVSNEKVNNSFEAIKKEERVNSSCHAFLYDELDLDIEKFDGNGYEGHTAAVTDELPFPIK